MKDRTNPPDLGELEFPSEETSPATSPEYDAAAWDRLEEQARQRREEQEQRRKLELEQQQRERAERESASRPCPGGCGAIVVGPVICEACREKQKRDSRASHAHHVRVCNFAARYRWCSFASEHLGARVRSARSIALARSRLDEDVNVAFVGPAGTGKTVLAHCRVNALLDLGVDKPEFFRRATGIRIVTAIELATVAAEHRLGRKRPELVDEAIEASVLLLDDLGAEHPAWTQVIVDVLHARHDADACTYTTTGLDEAALASRYSGGIVRRVFEGALTIRCGAAARAA